MDDVRSGRLLRALRRRLNMRQVDVAVRAGVSQSTVSLAERGHFDRLSLATIRALFRTVDSRFDGIVMWRGGAIDRLLDEDHAGLVGAFAARLRHFGWDVEVEVTFNDYGDRGSIDILGVKPSVRVVLIVEIKTELTAIDATIRRLDIKDRVAPKVVAARYGWKPTVIGRLVVLAEASKNRRRVAVHRHVLGVALPARGARVRSWLQRPTGRMSGLLFSSLTNARGSRPSPLRCNGPGGPELPPGIAAVGR